MQSTANDVNKIVTLKLLLYPVPIHPGTFVIYTCNKAIANVCDIATLIEASHDLSENCEAVIYMV